MVPGNETVTPAGTYMIPPLTFTFPTPIVLLPRKVKFPEPTVSTAFAGAVRLAPPSTSSELMDRLVVSAVVAVSRTLLVGPAWLMSVTYSAAGNGMIDTPSGEEP